MKIFSTMGESAAIERFKVTMSLPQLENVELRDHFAHLLISALHPLNPLPRRLVEAAALTLQWEDEASIITLDFNEEREYLLGRMRGWRAYDRLLQKVQMSLPQKGPPRGILSLSSPGTTSFQESRVAAVLTGSYRPAFFIWLSLRPSIGTEIIDVLKRLELFSPETIEYELDSRIVRWWRKSDTLMRFALRRLMWAFILSPVLTILLLERAHRSSGEQPSLLLALYWVISIITLTACFLAADYLWHAASHRWSAIESFGASVASVGAVLARVFLFFTMFCLSFVVMLIDLSGGSIWPLVVFALGLVLILLWREAYSA